MSIFIPGPGALTWDQAVAKVRGDLWRPGNSLPDDTVNRALHASCLQLEGECKWLWLENVTVVTTVNAAASYVDLPPTISRITSVGIKRDTEIDNLLERPMQMVRQLADSSTGDASAYALGDGRIYFDSSLEPETQLELVCTAQTPEELDEAVAAGSATLQRQQQAVIALACAIIALSRMKNEAEATRQQAIYDTILERLFNVEAERRGANIQPDTWGNGVHG